MKKYIILLILQLNVLFSVCQNRPTSENLDRILNTRPSFSTSKYCQIDDIECEERIDDPNISYCSCDTKSTCIYKLEYLSRQAPFIGVSLRFCRLELGPSFGVGIKFQKLEIVEAPTLFFTQGSFEFPDGVEISFKTLEQPFIMIDGMFGPGLNNVTFANVTLENFSTGAFNRMSSTANVRIIDSEIDTTNTPENSTGAHIKNLYMENVQFTNKVTHKFFQLGAEKVEFSNVKLELKAQGAMELLETEDLTFFNCSLGLLHSEAIIGTVGKASFINTKFTEIATNSLWKLGVINDSSTILFQNVTLMRPELGSFFISFPAAIYDRVIASTCRCDLVDYLLDSIYQNSRGLSVSLSKEDQANLLSNETYCEKENGIYKISDICNEHMPYLDEDQTLLIGLLSGAFVVVFLVAVATMIILNDRWKKKYFVYTRKKAMREATYKEHEIPQVPDRTYRKPVDVIFSISEDDYNERTQTNIPLSAIK